MERVALARVLAQAGDPHAPESLRDTLQRAYDEGFWLAVRDSLSTAVNMLADNQPTAAAEISGYLTGSSQGGTDVGGLDAGSVRHLQSADGSDLSRARGRAMDRRQIVTVVLDALGESETVERA